MLEFMLNNETFYIKKTKHRLDKRKDKDKYARDEFLTDEIYSNIFKTAIKEGLTSFRNKGCVVVTVKSYKDSWYSILCVLDNKNIITIITVYHFFHIQLYKAFITVKNRINIVNKYIVPKLQQKELFNKKLEIIDHHISKDESKDLFDKFVKNSGIRRLN